LSHTWPSSGTSYKILDRNDCYCPTTKYSYVVVVVVVGSVGSVSGGGAPAAATAAAAAAADDDDDNDHFWPSRWTNKLIADQNGCIVLVFKTHTSRHQ